MMANFTGSIVALVTPFQDGVLALEEYQAHIRFVVEAGSHGIVPCGTTGEAPALTAEEWEAAVQAAVAVAGSKVPVIAGTGTNSTAKTIQLTQRAETLGADGALVVTPYYNRPSQAGLEAHYRALAEATGLPIVIYNVPGRTGVNILPETVARLASVENIVGIKEASGDVHQAAEVASRCRPEFVLLSGDDGLVLPILGVGGRGVISVAANLVPREMAELVTAYLEGDLQRAQGLYRKLLPLAASLFVETNPVPVKTALGLLGRLPPEVRLPLVPLAPANLDRLRASLETYGLL